MSDSKIVVDPKDSNCYKTIADAIAAAEDGEKVYVKPGEYAEHLNIDKKLELLGEGSMEEIRIVNSRSNPLLVSHASVLLIKNISFVNRQSDAATITCESGIIDMEHVGIEGGEYGVHAQPGTRVALEESFISGAEMAGIFVNKCLSVSIDNCLIEKCGGPGIQSEDCNSVLVQHCTISDTSPNGIVATGEQAFEVIDTEFASVPEAVILDNDQAVDAAGERTWYRRTVVAE